MSLDYDQIKRLVITDLREAAAADRMVTHLLAYSEALGSLEQSNVAFGIQYILRSLLNRYGLAVQKTLQERSASLVSYFKAVKRRCPDVDLSEFNEELQRIRNLPQATSLKGARNSFIAHTSCILKKENKGARWMIFKNFCLRLANGLIMSKQKFQVKNLIRSRNMINMII